MTETRENKKPEGAGGPDGRYVNPRLFGKPFFQRKKACPFTGPKAPAIDYKDVRTLQRYVSQYGKMLPSHLTGVSQKNQRALAIAIKRARMLALLPFCSR